MKHLINSLTISVRMQLWLFFIALLLPNIVMAFTEPLPWYTNVAQLLFGAGLFASLMLLGKQPGRQFYVLFLFTFFAAFQLVLLWLYGNSPISVDMFLNLAATNANEAGELLGNIIVGVLIVCGFYIVVLLLAAMSWRRGVEIEAAWRNRIRRLYALPLLVASIVLCVVLQATTSFRFSADVYPIHVTYNMGMAVCRYAQLKMYDMNARDFVFDATTTHSADQPETYVLVIGETARSVNWSLYGYERETTPRLQRRDGLIVYRDVLSQSNTTHKSVPLLLTRAEAADPSPMYREKSLIAAFREAGFYTLYISNQADNGSLIDHYSCEADVRRYTRPEHENELPNDAFVLSAMREEIDRLGDSHPKRLFVIHLYGTHFKYCERTPKEFEHPFNPCSDVQLAARNREELVNAYDNNMLYTDMVVDSIISMSQSAHPSFVLMTSDHGEDLYDDDRNNFLHASPIVDFYQMAVPFVVWTNEPWKAAHPTKAERLNVNKNAPLSPGRVVFHTMLDAAGIRCAALQADHSLCDSAYVSGERLFLSDRNEALRLDQLHLTENDFREMERNGISF